MRIQGVLTHLTHPPQNQWSCHKLESLGGRQWSEYFSRQLVPVLSSWSPSHHYFEYPVMLHAIFPLYFTVIPCVCWLAVKCGYCRIEGEGDEAAFNQQLAPHKAFITPKRLRLPKPEWDKHCPFICNDVEARSNWTELRGKGQLWQSVDGFKGAGPVGVCFFTPQNHRCFSRGFNWITAQSCFTLINTVIICKMKTVSRDQIAPWSLKKFPFGLQIEILQSGWIFLGT